MLARLELEGSAGGAIAGNLQGMSDPSASKGADPEGTGATEPADRVGDALRSAVERTLAATAGSASETGRRARDLLDEVARRGEVARDGIARRGGAARDEVTRRREAARDEVTRRGEAARDEVVRVGEEASSKLADAIAELRQTSREDLGLVSERIGAVEGRLADLERVLRGTGSSRDTATSKPHENGPEAGHPNPPAEGESDASEAGPGG